MLAVIGERQALIRSRSLLKCEEEGCKHDAGMLGLLGELQRSAYSPHGRPMCLYGDPAYPLRVHLQTPSRNAVLPPPMQALNASMRTVWESVEWLFNGIVNY